MIRKSLLLDEELVGQIAILSQKEDRDFSSSLRHALRIGLLALQNPQPLKAYFLQGHGEGSLTDNGNFGLG